jgi:hypothetical protein
MNKEIQSELLATSVGRWSVTQITALLLAFLFCLATVYLSPAQSYSADWYEIASGGGTSTSGPLNGTNYSVGGTIGQPEACSAMTGGRFSVTGGFWSLFSVMQTAGAPTLYISHSGKAVTVYWQNVPGWSLQQNTNLALASWSASSGVTTSNGTNSLTAINPASNLFFRLNQ